MCQECVESGWVLTFIESELKNETIEFYDNLVGNYFQEAVDLAHTIDALKKIWYFFIFSAHCLLQAL